VKAVMLVSTILSIIYASHVFLHAYQNTTDSIYSSVIYIDSFCHNDTLVRLAKQHTSCDTARSIASQSAALEAFYISAEALWICSSRIEMHADGHSHTSSHNATHCSHMNYIGFGFIIGVIIVIYMIKYCANRDKGTSGK
jgi:hypothetical protein